MDTLQQLELELKRYSYKPGWTLEIFVKGNKFYYSYFLSIEFSVLDSRDDNSRFITVHGCYEIPDNLLRPLDSLRFAIFVQHSIFKAEMHESQEWLKRDGTLYDDPHRVGSNSGMD